MDPSITWQGFLRDDGRKGIRNIVLVVYTVECASHVAHRIADGEENVHVIGFPGCYDNQYAINLMLAMVRHPNVGAVLSVGLGCEYTRPEGIGKVAAAAGRLSDWFSIQENGGTLASIAKGKRIVTEMSRSLADNARRVPMVLADLVIGSECGGSDATSGLAANPVVGAVSDLLVDAGGTAIWEEIVEMIGLKNALVSRAARPAAAAAIACAYDKAEEYCRAVRQYSVSPGNFAGGLTTIEEKSLGSYAKSGSRPIQGVIKVAELPASHGLWLMDTVPDPHFMQFGYTNPNDTEGLMDLMSGGAQILFYTTGRGSCTGSPIAPTIKVTGNPRTYAALEGDMDFNAGRVLSGETTVAQAAEELLGLVVRVAAGEQTKPERLGHREYFVMYKHQDAPSLAEGCRA
jgi:altronate dehydratase large subunit